MDFAVYGRYQPSHHLLVRRATVQNLFDPLERDGETSESLSMDGMKFNQVEDLWVPDCRVSQTTRHGIDNVGVHRVELGGVETDATYFPSDGRWDYEALRVTARNNLIVDARAAALEFSGCQDCTAINNTVF